MSVYWNERTGSLLPYVPGEQPRDRNFIKLNTNENPYPPSPLVLEAVKKAAAETLRLYPDPACTELREAIAARYNLKSSQVFAGNGSDEVLAFAFGAFFGKKENESLRDNVLLFPDITYSFYPAYAALWNVQYKTIPLREDFSVDVSAYCGSSGGIIFPNPNAPTGMALSARDVKKIAGAAAEKNSVLVVDEAYAAFAGEGVSAVPLLGEFPNILVVRTLSKEASLAGLRAGFALGSEELIEGLCRVRDSFNSYTLDRLALAGAVAAVKDAAYYEEINRRVIVTRNRVSSGLAAIGFRVLPSSANFVFAAPPAGTEKNACEFLAALRERGILVRHFNKAGIADYLRISIGTDDDMDTFLKACAEIIGNKR